MLKIKFGTDGWRAIIAKEYTVDNVRRVAKGTADWMNSNNHHSVVIGFDTRFGGELFAKEVSVIFAENGLKVYFGEEFVSTPMVSFGTSRLSADMGVVITASHNPPSYNGYKLKSSYGGPTIPADIKAVEDAIPDNLVNPVSSFEEHVASGMIRKIDLVKMYTDHVIANFDLDSMRDFPGHFAYDAMYGAGQNIVPALFPNAHHMHCSYNPSFMGQAPEPIHRNLSEMSAYIKDTKECFGGLANDGDADRIGMYDGSGNFVDSHHLMLLLLYYLFEIKKMSGKVIITFSVSEKVKKLAEHYGLEVEVTKIGFKYIAEIMINEDVLIGGEESGGIAVKGHIPERDGIWMGLLIFELMSKTGKSIEELVSDVYDIVGSFSYNRRDLHMTENQKIIALEKLRNGSFTNIGGTSFTSSETMDGFKYFINKDEWVMIRPSGTEPVLRVYAQGINKTNVENILDMSCKELLA